MAKVVIYIPEPKPEYSIDNQRQILQALDTLQNQLNTSYQNDLKNEQETFSWFVFSGPGS